MLHPLLEVLFQAFDREGVRWCILRGERYLWGATNHDVDVLVHPADASRARAVLYAHQFAQISSWGQGAHSWFVCFHPPTAAWIEIDLQSKLAYGPYLDLWTSAASGCVARRRRCENLWVLAAGDAFWTLFLHCMLNKRAFRPDYAARLQELVGAASTNNPLAKQVGSICPLGWDPAQLLRSVELGDWNSLLGLAAVLTARWRRSDPVRTWGRAAANRALRWPQKARDRLRRRGVSVALLGPDGAGKSTLMAGIQRSFYLYLPVRSFYMGVWPRTQEFLSPTSPARTSSVVFMVRLLATVSHIWNLWWRYFASQVHLALGRTVIFDRYVYDRLLFTQQSVGRLKWLYLRLMPPISPSPDLVLVLDVPGSVMFARKGERSPEHLESQRQILLALGHHLPHAQIVDGTLAEPAIRADVIGRIWSRSCARWNSHRHHDGSPQGQLASGRTLPADPPLATAQGLPFAADRAGSSRDEREGVYEADR